VVIFFLYFTFNSSSTSLTAEANSWIDVVNGCRDILWSNMLLNLSQYNCPRQGKNMKLREMINIARSYFMKLSWTVWLARQTMIDHVFHQNQELKSSIFYRNNFSIKIGRWVFSFFTDKTHQFYVFSRRFLHYVYHCCKINIWI